MKADIQRYADIEKKMQVLRKQNQTLADNNWQLQADLDIALNHWPNLGIPLHTRLASLQKDYAQCDSSVTPGTTLQRSRAADSTKCAPQQQRSRQDVLSAYTAPVFGA